MVKKSEGYILSDYVKASLNYLESFVGPESRGESDIYTAILNNVRTSRLQKEFNEIKSSSKPHSFNDWWTAVNAVGKMSRSNRLNAMDVLQLTIPDPDMLIERIAAGEHAERIEKKAESYKKHAGEFASLTLSRDEI